jgi:hypothetical protein
MKAKQFLMRLSIASLVAGVVAVGVCAYLGISTSLHAENALHAVLSTIKTVNQFVAAEHRWPKSWDELQPYREKVSEDEDSWEVESSRLKKYVGIDFNADLDEIASQTPERFKAVYPTGACYPYTDYGILQKLLETVKQVTERDTGTKTSDTK